MKSLCSISFCLLTLISVALVVAGCVELPDILDKAKPVVGDSPEVLAEKEKLAEYQTKWAKEKKNLQENFRLLQESTSITIGKLQEELDQQRRLNEEQLRQIQEHFDNELFPYRYFYLGAFGVVLVMTIVAFSRKNIPLVALGVGLAFILLGIAQIQKKYPEVFVYCTIACLVPVAIYFIVFGISWLRKETTIKVLAQAIESDQDTKEFIKSDSGVAAFIEKQVRRYLPPKKEQETQEMTNQGNDSAA